MGRIIVVSNRLPVTARKIKGVLDFRQSIGGLATGLASFETQSEKLWLGWCGLEDEKINQKEKTRIKNTLRRKFSSFPVFLNSKDIEVHYGGFCNKTLWPLFHYFVQYAEYEKNMWDAYRNVNEKFLKSILKIAKKGDTIWIHDYHLFLLPKMLREKRPDLTIGFFLHIPFPSFEVFRLLPWRKELVEGMLGADLVGFHQYDYVKHFLDSVHFLTGHEHEAGQINAHGRVIKADAFPMGINYEKYSESRKREDVAKQMKLFRKQVGERKVILSIDRLDYTKGILQRLDAFEMFLSKNPSMKTKVVMVMVAVPSRTNVEHYKTLRKYLDERIGSINGRYGTVQWTPVIYIRRFIPESMLLALYQLADIELITPLRDGMNLMAKEFIAAKNGGKGVLILSEMAGASKELVEAITVNPNNREEIESAIEKAITMSCDEQKENNRIMRDRLRRYDITRWVNDFMEKLENTKELEKNLKKRILSKKEESDITERYVKSKKRLFLLDYDGTLTSIVGSPKKAKPDKQITGILKKLSQDPRNEVVLVSGRDRKTMDKWFGKLDIGIVAEHGIWIKKRGGRWFLIEPMDSDWKDEIRTVIEKYVDRTPGSFLEEKEFSLVWHYRNAIPDQASIRAWELKDDLIHLTANQDLGILEGGKVIEVKKEGVNKGRACLTWTEKRRWDFILAAGDDRTDEDMFNILPDNAFTVKVGIASSHARILAESSGRIRGLLKSILKARNS
ncbi:MAG: bifunctional alpha,alpha-trehalose-phosphate synthase (UDP-forming)/trehalose-phosphatase [Candidatus Aenigmarchaeota archaeon]|nr:bifunctional alpha,alpha-trehalose-phosphate synthase (UDP-forming)/trehalose-phosphatase [Candidatus Aenigmarchaeota archaeon]